MANPFYIGKTESIGDSLLDMAKTLSTQRANENALAVSRAQVGLDARKQAHTEAMDAHGVAMDKANLSVNEENNRLEALKLEEAKPAYMQKFNHEMMTKPIGKAKVLFGKKGFSAMSPVIQTIKELATTGLTRYEAATTLVKKWPGHRREILPKLQNILTEDPEILQTEEGQSIAKLADAIGQDKDGAIIKDLFGETFSTYEWDQQERENAEKDRQLYETTSGWQTADNAVGLSKPVTPKEPKLYPTADGYLPAGKAEGVLPYSKPGSKTSLQTDKDGNVVFEQSEGMENTVGARTDMQKTLVAAKERLARLKKIKDGIKPEFLEFGAKWKNLTTKWKEKYKDTPIGDLVNILKPEDISDADRRTLSEFSAWRAEALENINRYINEITGAQMSVQEANRLRKTMPDPGEGLFDGDSYSEFMGKIDVAIENANLLTARYNHYLNSGIVDEKQLKAMAEADMIEKVIGEDGKSNGRMEEIMKQKANEFGAQLEAQGWKKGSPETAEEVRRMMSEHFGL